MFSFVEEMKIYYKLMKRNNIKFDYQENCDEIKNKLNKFFENFIEETFDNIKNGANLTNIIKTKILDTFKIANRLQNY